MTDPGSGRLSFLRAVRSAAHGVQILKASPLRRRSYGMLPNALGAVSVLPTARKRLFRFQTVRYVSIDPLVSIAEHVYLSALPLH